MYYINVILMLFIFINKTWCSCVLDVPSEFGSHAPLLVDGVSKKIVYPQQTNAKVVEVKSHHKLVANCPESSITISGVSIKKAHAILSCVGDTRFKLLNGAVHKFKDIRCSKKPRVTTRQTEQQCAIGNLIEIGFMSISSSFISMVDFCYNKDTAATYWAHSIIPAAIFNNESKEKKKSLFKYKTLEIPKGVDVVHAYIRSEQRKILLEIMNGNQELVDKYIPLTGTSFFARGLLITRADKFYLTEQHSTFSYINALPIWQCVNDGNWKMIEGETRKLAKITGDVDVYSGGLYTLRLPYTETDNRDIFLTKNKNTGAPLLFVPSLLFKLVYNPQQRRAIVYITINNPFLSEGNIPGKYIICREYKACSLKNQSKAKNVEKGYSYCCLYNDFVQDVFVQSIGLPSLPNVQPLLL